MKTCLIALFLLLAVGCKRADAGKSFQETKIEAEKGNARAQSNIGFMYAMGQGVPKDEVEAYKWFLLAGAQGDEDAKEIIPFIEGNITPAQRAEGQRLAREWKPRKLNPTYEFHP